MCYLPKYTTIKKNNTEFIDVQEINNVNNLHINEIYDSDNNKDEYLHMFKVSVCLLIYGIIMSKFILYLKM